MVTRYFDESRWIIIFMGGKTLPNHDSCHSSLTTHHCLYHPTGNCIGGKGVSERIARIRIARSLGVRVRGNSMQGGSFDQPGMTLADEGHLDGSAFSFGIGQLVFELGKRAILQSG